MIVVFDYNSNPFWINKTTLFLKQKEMEEEFKKANESISKLLWFLDIVPSYKRILKEQKDATPSSAAIQVYIYFIQNNLLINIIRVYLMQ